MTTFEQLRQRHRQQRRDVGRGRPGGESAITPFDQRALAHGGVADVLHRARAAAAPRWNASCDSARSSDCPAANARQTRAAASSTSASGGADAAGFKHRRVRSTCGLRRDRMAGEELARAHATRARRAAVRSGAARRRRRRRRCRRRSAPSIVPGTDVAAQRDRHSTPDPQRRRAKLRLRHRKRVERTHLARQHRGRQRPVERGFSLRDLVGVGHTGRPAAAARPSVAIEVSARTSSRAPRSPRRSVNRAVVSSAAISMRLLEKHRAGIESGVHLHDRDAGRRIAGLDRSSDRRGAAPARQQRRVHVDRGQGAGPPVRSPRGMSSTSCGRIRP